MNPAKSSISNVNTQKQLLEKAEADKSTLGQRVADATAAKVGSWSFLIGQSNSKMPKEVLVYLPFNFEKSKEDNI
ncbi:MAG: hypothetical protein V7L01_11520 [Nostoc sp.]|uniref:hypothetical protein n=1 Tax=Nostoc sp. TaxID=1180 RepID=UPI002FFB90E2